jgi:hypothetical protein
MYHNAFHKIKKIYPTGIERKVAGFQVHGKYALA